MKREQKISRKSGGEGGSTVSHLHKAISRRNLLAGAAALGAGGGLLRAADSKAAGPPSASPRVIALVGDRYHNPDYIRVSLDRLFSELGMPVDYTFRYDKLSRDLLRGYRILVCFRDGMIWPGGYLGPDAYSYERELENPGDFPRQNQRNGSRRSRRKRSVTSLRRATAYIACTTAATFRFPPQLTGK